MNKKYSIILPVRNGYKYIRECVGSILEQSYDEFDLHILDNDSTDGTVEWIESLHDERIVFTRSDKPLTIEESWQRILALKKNEFMTTIGHDDILNKNYLENIDQLISRYPDASLYQTHFNLIDDKGKEIRKCKKMPEKERADQLLASILQNNFDIYGTGYMMRSADYDRTGGIPTYPNLLFADFELWMELTRLNYKATSSKECFSYRIHQSTTKGSSDIKMHAAFLRFISYLEKIQSEDPKLDEVIKAYAPAFLCGYCRSFAHRLIRKPLSERAGLTVNDFLNDCRQWTNLLSAKNSSDLVFDKSVRAARFIDSNFITRSLFLLFKKMYPKPVLK